MTQPLHFLIIFAFFAVRCDNSLIFCSNGLHRAAGNAGLFGMSNFSISIAEKMQCWRDSPVVSPFSVKRATLVHQDVNYVSIQPRDVPVDRVGATHAEECLDWLPPTLERLHAAGSESGDPLLVLHHNLLHLLNISSDYSGTLNFETFIKWLRRGVTDRGLPIGPVNFQRCGDLAERCRSVALAIDGEDSCVFGDMTKRAESLPELQSLCEMIRDMHIAQKETCTREKATRKIKQACGRKFMKAVVNVLQEHKASGCLDAMRGNVLGECHRHNAYCSISVNSSHDGGIGLHASGVTCIDWSSRGCGWGVLGESFDAFVTFLIERLIEEEDIILIECTELFDWPAFIELFSALYVAHVFKFSPHHCGTPVHRLRVYLALFKKSTMQMTSAVVPFNDGAFFKHNFLEMVLMSGSDMLRAPNDVVEEALSGKAVDLGLSPRRPSGSCWSGKQVLGAAKRRRLKRYMYVASNNDISCADKIVDHNQEPPHGSFTNIVSCLTRSTHPWSFCKGRLVLCGEQLECQGIPFYTEPSQTCCHTAFQQMIKDGRLTQRDAEQMGGNAMHMRAIGTIVIYALSVSRFGRLQSGPLRTSTALPALSSEKTNGRLAAPTDSDTWSDADTVAFFDDHDS